MPTSTDKNRTVDLANALGASRQVSLPSGGGQGPLGLLQLQSEVAHRLHSTGGRPTDPMWTVRRIVPFSSDGWAELEQVSLRLTAMGRSVSPAQLAALLIERGLATLEEGIARDGDAALQQVFR